MSMLEMARLMNGVRNSGLYKQFKERIDFLFDLKKQKILSDDDYLKHYERTLRAFAGCIE